MKDVIKNDDTNKNKDISTNDYTLKEVINNNDNDMTFSHQIESSLMELTKNYDKIMTLINSDKSMNDDIIIELPVETKGNYRTAL